MWLAADLRKVSPLNSKKIPFRTFQQTLGLFQHRPKKEKSLMDTFL